MHTQQMPRRAGDSTPEGQHWLTEIRAAQRAVEAAERARDETVQRALDHGFGIRGVARALGVDKMTAHRHYGGRRKSVKIRYYIDGEPVPVPDQMTVSHAANLAMRVLQRKGPRMILERESGEPLNQLAAIGEVSAPGERFKLVPASADDRSVR